MARRFSWILALGVAVATSLSASDASAKGSPRSWGGFGHGFAGFVVGDLGGFDSRLEADSALGEGAGPIMFGGMIGGGGRALLGRRIMLGGKGYALLSPVQEGRYGHARVVGGGGGLDLGVALYNDDGWLVYPYAGFQGFGMGLELNNQSTEPRSVDDVPIPVGQSRGLSAGFPLVELGAGAQRLLFGDAHGGFMIGLELGFLYSVGREGWTLDDAPVLGLGSASLNGGYLRLTLGGGGFFDRGRRRRRAR